MQKSLITGNWQQTKSVGKEFAKLLNPGDVIALFGELGSGKTTFIQGLAEGLGIETFVTSPSFVIINEYPCFKDGKKLSFFHVDLYRLENENDIENLGLVDLFNENSIVAIEWAEKSQKFLPKQCKKIYFEFISENEREVKIS